MGNNIRFIKLHKYKFKSFSDFADLLFRSVLVFHSGSSNICWLRMLNISYMTLDCFIDPDRHWGQTAQHQCVGT